MTVIDNADFCGQTVTGNGVGQDIILIVDMVPLTKVTYTNGTTY